MALSAAALVAGLAAWAWCAGADADRAWRSLLINFVYFCPLSVGMVLWPAIARLSRGRWAVGRLEQSALSAVTLAPVWLVALAALYLGRSHWAAWIGQAAPAQRWWLNENFLFARDGAALVVMLALAIWFVLAVRRGQAASVLGGWLIVVYCLVFTLLGMDLVMSLDPQWYSCLFGGYYFISALYCSLAAWTLAVLLRNPALEERRKSDFGKLIVAFSLLTTYLMYSQLIVIWYEQLPAEVRFVIPRMAQPPWQLVSLALLGTVYLGPLVFLLLRRAKGSTAYLAMASAAVLVMMWVERWWLVTPTLQGPLVYGLAEASMTAAFGGAFVLGMGLYLRPRAATREAIE